MTKQETERLRIMEIQVGRLEEKVDGVDSRLGCIEGKLDKALATKADQKDLDNLKKTLQIIMGAAVAAFFGLIVYAIQKAH